jgi:4-amino-4-deoxy-L-arabinose transferase-like glycosyltransferase
VTGREARKQQNGPRSKVPGKAGRVPKPKTGPRILILFGVLIAGVAVQLGVSGSHRIHWSSDQAIVGLMARHILHGTAYPVFYYGSAYAGTLESSYMAAVFSVAGSSVASYRASLMILLALLSLIVYAIGRRVFGVAASLFAVSYLAIPPYFFLYKGLTSDGAYVSLAVIGAALLYGAVRLDEAEASGWSSLRWFALIGFLAGLGWWVMPLIVYFYIAILLWFVIVRPRAFIGFARCLVFLAAFSLGSAPWWWANVGRGWPSLHTPALARGSVGAVGKGVLEFFSPGVPCLLGARPVPRYADVFPAASAIALLLFVGTVIAAVWVGVRLRWGNDLRVADEERRRARVLLLLLLSIVSMQVVVAFNPDTYVMDPRYLYPFYAPFALLFGFAVTLVGRTRLAWASVPILTGVLAFNGVSLVRAPRVDLAKFQPTPVPLKELIGVLDKLGITDVYTSYWTAYRLAFESDERIRAASFGDGNDRSDRYPPYAQAVALSGNPAFILWGEEAERFRRYLRARGSGAEFVRVGAYQVFLGVSPDVRREMAELRRVPPE